MSDRVRMPHEHGIASFVYAPRLTVESLSCGDLVQYANQGYVEPRGEGEEHVKAYYRCRKGYSSKVKDEPCIQALGVISVESDEDVNGRYALIVTERHGKIRADVFADSILLECDAMAERDLMRDLYLAGGEPRRMGDFIFVKRSNYDNYTSENEKYA